MRILSLFCLLLLSTLVQAQLKIKIAVKRTGTDIKTTTSYSDDTGNPLQPGTDKAKIQSALSNGCIIAVSKAGSEGITYDIQHIKDDGGIASLVEEHRVLGNLATYNFDAALVLQDSSFDADEQPESIELNRFIIAFDNEPGSPFAINMDEIIKPFSGKGNGNIRSRVAATTTPGCIDCFSKKSSKDILLYYDFNCKTFYKDTGANRKAVDMGKLWIKGNQTVRLIIENVNRYLYNVTVTYRDREYDSKMPPLFYNLFYGDTSKQLTALMNAFSQGKADTTGRIKNAQDIFIKKLKNFTRTINKLKARRLSAFLSCTSFPCCNDSEVDGILYETLLNDLDELRAALNDFKSIVYEESSLEEMKEAIKNDRTALADCKKKESDFLKFKADKENEKQKLNPDKDKAAIDAIDKLIETAQKASCSSRNDIQAELNEKNARFILMKKVEAFQASLPSDTAVEMLYAFAANVRAMNNMYIAPPMQGQGNALDIGIEIRPYTDTAFGKKWSLSPLYSDSFSLELPVVKRFFVSFSSGSFINIGKRTLFNKTYGWQPLASGNNTITDTSKQLLTETGYSAPPMGFAALLNVEYKLFPFLGVGVSAGVGLTIEKTPRLSYLAGGSLFIGNRKQIALTGGIMAMQVNKLTNNLQAVYDQQIIYNVKPPAIEYYKELKAGAFISLTYTPFSEIVTKRSKSGK